MNWKLWIKCAAVRAVATFAEAMISMLTIGQAFVDVNWLHILSVSGVAALLAVLRCLKGLPEVDQQTQVVRFDDDQHDGAQAYEEEN